MSKLCYISDKAYLFQVQVESKIDQLFGIIFEE